MSRSSRSSGPITSPSKSVSLFAELASQAGVFLDFDGTLSEIAPHPDQAQASPGAREAVEALVPVFAFVAVVTGRPSAEVAERLGAQGVHYEGLYGLEALPPVPEKLLAAIQKVADMVPQAWVEQKGASAAVHVRGVSDPAAAERTVAKALAGAAVSHGYEIAAGKMVLDFVPAGRGRKGAVVERLARENELRAVFYAGDDVADIEAFEALETLAAQGVRTVAVAVSSTEAPAELLEAAALVVNGPAGLVELLRQLA